MRNKRTIFHNSSLKGFLISKQTPLLSIDLIQYVVNYTKMTSKQTPLLSIDLIQYVVNYTKIDK